MDGSSDEEDDQFFETAEEIASPSDSGSDASEIEKGARKLMTSESKGKYEVWKTEPISIRERRQRFLRGLGLLESKQNSETIAENGETESLVVERLTEDLGTVLLTHTTDSSPASDKISQAKESDMLARSTSSSESAEQSSIGCDSQFDSREFVLRIKNLDSGKEFIVDELGQDGSWNKLRELGTDNEVSFADFEKSLGFSPLVQELMRRETDIDVSLSSDELPIKKKKKRWLSSLRFASSRSFGGSRAASDCDKSGRSSGTYDVSVESPQRIKVCHHKKHYKEFSALFMGQEIQAHEGSVWTMKFSLDGRFLASAGQDCVIHVREVIETDRKFGGSTPIDDDASSNSSFSTAGDTLIMEEMYKKWNNGKHKSKKNNSKSDFIVLPKKLFKLSEKPFCSLRGHQEDVLDLSWSASQLLLSSSMDKTVRLWDIGRQICLKFFSHKDYVPCIQFNPVDDRYFISGSLDGKVRIWSVTDGHVVDWMDVREMVTATCYTPDGQRGLVGTIKGNCRLYSIAGNKLQLDSQLVISKRKKKTSGKITGFQFAPGDSQKVLITSADSRVRVLDGDDVIFKYKGGFQNTCSQISASFSPNGKHVISASEDNRVYIWNYDITRATAAKNKKTCWSNEHFKSPSVSVAIPWSGITSRASDLATNAVPSCRESPKSWDINQTPYMCGSRFLTELNNQDNICTYSSSYSDSCQATPYSYRSSPGNSDSMNSSHAFFSDSLPKGSATWPEEKLPTSSMDNLPRFTPTYDILETESGEDIQSQSKGAAAFAWGAVIVTAGQGGEIKTFQNYGLPIRS